MLACSGGSFARICVKVCLVERCCLVEGGCLEKGLISLLSASLLLDSNMATSLDGLSELELEGLDRCRARPRKLNIALGAGVQLDCVPVLSALSHNVGAYQAEATTGAVP